ncbi:SDR family NAD(P)-dependent oxidoreductase [Acrocarpospora sp. B8E8]|uniref:SDR family NAD(P)-dependent oxidoreductase n=1 Tax=Acrocarpospora sp. B8E8 TaxID=3153572 RepID=UPI00325EF69B
MVALEGKVVLITGGARGQGAAEAELAAAMGARVVIGDLLEGEGIELADALNARHGADSAHFVSLDVRSEESWRSIVADTLARYGRLDGLVNNAGIARPGTILDTAPSLWDELMDVNARGSFLGIRAVAPVMIEQGGGAIVNIGSAVALAGYHAAAYGVSKWAVRGLTKAAALEFAAAGIRVNAVHPGIVDTPMVAANPRQRDAVTAMTPAGRPAAAADIAQVVIFLLSDGAAYLTGADIPVDGGFSSGGTALQIARATGVL